MLSAKNNKSHIRPVISGITLAVALLIPALSQAADKITLRYAIWDRNQLPAEQKIAQSFEKANPDINIDIEVVPASQYFVKLDSAVAGGVAPDIFWVNMPYFIQYAQNHVLAPLNGYLNDKSVDLNNIVASSVKAYQFDGNQLAIPRDVDAIAVWYNKKLFDQAGVSYPKKGWTWDDLKTTATALKTKLKGDAFPLYMDLSNDGQESYLNLLYQKGVHIVPTNGQPTDIASDNAIWVYQQLQQMMKGGLLPTANQMSELKTDSVFTSNRAAMVYAGSWQAAPFASNPQINDHIGVIEMPRIDKEAGVAHSLGFALYANGKHKDAAWRYVSFMAQKSSQEELAAAVIPANKQAMPAWAANVKQVDVTAYLTALDHATAYPTAGTNTPKWQNMWISSLKKIFMGADAKEEMDKSVKKISRVMEK
ncbi:MAG: sugar ABC transporter substrate-binding protein [Pantoea sp.]|uniref:ABC transporter substrate-binding protein n=1 Tax=Pantoea sp. TaxID=69393 RepID=UPI0023907400|nr:sugar ABC transporter substrate-binding protein [Pantoea sp.]MDE1187706.1 sugar ABC transporter substrate-binding protein [Pantoea sp.]